MHSLGSKLQDFSVLLVGNQLYTLTLKTLPGFLKCLETIVARFGIFWPFYGKQNRAVE